jgi:transposase
MGKTTTEALLDDAGYIEVNEGELKYKVINLVKEEQNQSEHPARFIKNLIACYSKRRKRKDEYDRSKALSRINKTIGKTTRSQLKGVLSKSYVGTNMTASEAETITINEKKLAAATRLEGYFGYITNTNLPPDEIIAQYKGLWQVEQTFRVTKHNLAIRPVYHFVDRRIKAHFAICYLSLALLRTVEMGLRKANQYLPIEELHMLLSRMHQVKLTVGKRQCTIITEREAVAKIFAGLGLVLPPKLQLASC